ncbi:MAG: ABC transporter ATP-binding protein [Candidatus Methanodesulfokora washburnensis]
MEERGSLKGIISSCLEVSRHLLLDQLLILSLWSLMMVISLFLATIRRDLIDYLTSTPKELSLIIKLGLLLLLLDIVASLMNFFSEYRLQILGVKAYNIISRKALDKIFYSRSRLLGGDILTRFISDMPNLSDTLGGFIPSLAIQIIRIIGGLIILLVLSPELTLLAVIAIAPLYFLYRYTSRMTITYSSREREAMSGMASEIKQVVDASGLVRRTLSKGYFLNRTWNSAISWMRNLTKLLFFKVFFNQAFYSVYGMLSFIMLIAGGYLVYIGHTTVGTVISFTGAMYNIYEPLVNISGQIVGALSMVPYVRRYREIIGLEEEDINSGRSLEIIEELKAEKMSITLDGFSILRGINLSAKRGEIIGITGPSGSGKTTLLLTMIRFVEPSSGHLLINGSDYRTFRLRDLRRLIYYVPSEDFILKASLRENLSLGDDAEEDVLRKAVEVAGIDFATLDDIVDPEKLSLGQKQRIALARALIRRPQVLLLDESLSGLETPLEDMVLRKVIEYLKNSIILVVSHRLSALRHASRIYVMSGGEIIDAGSHEELYKRCQLYKEIVEKYNI